jgi:hypothetical protein
MGRCRALEVVVAGIGLGCGVLAGCTEPSGSVGALATERLIRGEVDTGHSGVVGIYTVERGVPAVCTGALIAPDLVCEAHAEFLLV